MGVSQSNQYRAIRKSVREFAENEIEPKAREFDEAKKFPREIIREAAKYDFVGPNIPAEYEGAEMDARSCTIIAEELWRVDPGIGSAIGNAGYPGAVKMFDNYFDNWMKEEYFPGIVDGEIIPALAISEAAHGSDVSGMETTAEKNGDEYVINGSKMWISNGSVADFCVVMAKTEPDEGVHGISAFLVPTETDGYAAHPIDNKLGLHAADLAEVTLNDVRIPAANLVGEENKGFFHLLDFLELGRITVAAQATGAAQGAFEAACEYAKQREQFDQPVSEFQAIRHKLAEMATNIEAARSLTYRAVEYIDDPELSTRYASMAKLFASEHAVDVSDEALQVHGGAGYVTDHPVERFYRDARVTKVYEGTSEIQKNIIADDIL